MRLSSWLTQSNTDSVCSFAGLYNTFCLIPAFFLLHWTGLEPFQLPPTSTAWLICIINMVITFFSDYIYVLGECSKPEPTDAELLESRSQNISYGYVAVLAIGELPLR